MKVLIIESDGEVAAFLKRGLAAEMCVVDIARTGAQGITCVRNNIYDVIILTYYLGDMTGMEVSTAIRIHNPSVPILVLTTERNMDIKVDMLSVCDDYMTRPFSLCELIARLRALTRRGSIMRNEIVHRGDLMLDSRKYIVTLNGEEVRLRHKEFALLEYLMHHPDIVVSREMILSHVWDMNADPFTNTVDTHIRLLRKKLEDQTRTFIHTVPKRGYRFSA